MNIQRVEELIHELLLEIGEDPNREGLLKTPTGWPRPSNFSRAAMR